jgi:hypothetical protein
MEHISSESLVFNCNDIIIQFAKPPVMVMQGKYYLNNFIILIITESGKLVMDFFLQHLLLLFEQNIKKYN